MIFGQICCRDHGASHTKLGHGLHLSEARKKKKLGEGKRSWSSRGAEHDLGRACNGESAIKQLIMTSTHETPRSSNEELRNSVRVVALND